MEELMDFDITPKEVNVRIGGELYVLKEATGDAACKWQNKAVNATKLGPDGKPVAVGNIADIEPYLLSLCLFPVNKDGVVADKAVPEPIIRQWPSHVTSKLYEKVLVMSGLRKEKTKAELEKELIELQQKLEVMDTDQEASPKV